MARNVCSIGDQYIPASFNGVPFVCIEATSEHGRRGAEGQFPFGESTAYADLGRRIRTYTLRGKFVEDNHVLMVAALIAACELPGPGILVHPTRGIVSAACKSIHVEDKIEEEAGVTYVDLDFVEGNAWPNGLSLVGFVLGLALGAIVGASRNSFRRRYNPRAATPVRRPAVIDTAQESISLVSTAYGLAIQDQNDVKKWRIHSDLNTVEHDDVLASDPVIADRAISLGMGALAPELTTTKFNTYRGFANWAAKPVTLTGIAGESQDAVYSHTRIMSAAFMAQAAMETQYSRVSEALAHLDAILNILEDEAKAARDRCDNELYLAIANFRIDVQRNIYEKTYRLPSNVIYNFHAGVHALSAAYAIYNDAKRHRELELKNPVDATGRIGPLVVATNA